jgi:hypothetical protein
LPVGVELQQTAPSIDTPRWLTKIAILAIIVGGAVRLWGYTQRGSLWLDEASLALNVLGRGFGGLAAPLDWGQAAPIGFLWMMKALTVVLGSGEWVLRFWPFVAGVATLPLTWLAGRRLVGAPAAMLATVAMAWSLIAIRYSTEAKPYASDACIALALVWLALRVHEDITNKGKWRALRAAGVIGLLISLPSAFVLGAIGISLFPAARRAGRWPGIAVIAASLEWITTFVILWFVVVREASGSAYLKEYWAPVMLDWSAPDFLARVIRMLASVAATPLRWDGDLAPALVAMVVAACGVWSVARKNAAFALLVAGPAALGAIASLVGLYPMSDRLAFFAAPLVLLASAKCVAGAVSMLAARLAPRSVARAAEGASIAAAVVLGVWVGADSWRMVRSPGTLEPTRDLYRAIYAEARRDSVPVYVFARAAPAWLYATMDWSPLDAPRYEYYRVTTGNTDREGHENFSRPGEVVPGTGDRLALRSEGLTELIGLAPGVRYRVAGPMSREVPSAGWATEEARRINATAYPSAWIVASHFFEGIPRDELRPLVDELRHAGARASDERRGGRDALALRIEAPRLPTPAASPPPR